MMKIEIFPRLTLRGRRWFFRIKARNGEIIAQSEGVKNRSDCTSTVHTIMYNAPSAKVVYL